MLSDYSDFVSIDERSWSKRELKFNIETAIQCGGSCEGCVLTEDMRRDHGYRIDRNNMSLLQGYLRQYIQDYSERFGSPHEITVNLGQGDHLLMDDDDIHYLIDWLHDTFNGQATGFITVSLVGKNDIVKRKLDVWHNHAVKKQQIVNVDVVFSPKLATLQQFAFVYAENFRHLYETFGGADIVVNLGNDVIDKVGGKELFHVLSDAGASIVTPTLPPFVLNKVKDRKRLFDWLVDIYQAWIDHLNSGQDVKTDVGFGAVLGRAIHFGQKEEADPDYMHRAEMYIWFRNGFPQVFLSGTSIGDIPVLQHDGYPMMAKIQPDGLSIMKQFDSKIERVKVIVSSFLSRRQCVTCPHRNACKQFTFPYLKYKINDSEASCPIGIRSLMDVALKSIVNNLDRNSKCYQKQIPILQRGLDKTDMMESVPITALQSDAIKPYHIISALRKEDAD